MKTFFVNRQQKTPADEGGVRLGLTEKKCCYRLAASRDITLLDEPPRDPRNVFSAYRCAFVIAAFTTLLTDIRSACYFVTR